VKDSIKELELSILSNMIQRMPVYMRLSGYTADLFETPDYGAWFEAVKECYETAGACDMLTVMSKLDAGVYSRHFGEIAIAPISIATIDQHIDTIVGIYRKRIIDRACRVAMDKHTADESYNTLVEGLELSALGGCNNGETVEEIASAGLDNLTVAEDLMPTGFAPIDQHLRGIGRGELIVIGGYAKGGKTTLALQLALDMSKGCRVNYYSLEMTRPEVFRKLLSRKATVLTDLMSAGKMSPDVKGRLQTTMDLFKSGSYKFKIIDNLYSIDEIIADARISWMQNDMRVMVVDYLQLCETHYVKGEQRYLTVGKITRKLKQFAQQTGVRVFVLSQLTGNDDEKPTLQNFRESGNIGMDCNVPILTWANRSNGNHYIIIDRNRRTAPCDIDVVFEGHYSRFRDATAATQNWQDIG